MCKHAKGLRVPEKTADADEQIFEEEVELMGLLLYELDVPLGLRDLVDVQPPG